jgi:hypothetical protein
MFPNRDRLIVVTSGLVLACVVLLASPRSANALDNISTRSNVGLDDNVLIAGFIVTGTQPKKVIIRAIGPSLDVLGHLENPTLELRDSGGTLLDSNDDWMSSPDKQAIMDSGVQPANKLESAIVATLPSNGSSFTATVRGVNGTTGIGVVEVYDLNRGAGSMLANISTRGFAGFERNVLIAGTIITGSSEKVLIRAIGPSLALPDGLADPLLELWNANGFQLGNDNWRRSQEQEIIQTGAPPDDDYESAIVTTLDPGNYTAIVRGTQVSDVPPPSVSRIHHGSGNTVEIQQVQFSRTPIAGTFRLSFSLPSSIVAGQPGDKAALQDSITIPWNATADEIKTAILASSNFYKYDQNNHLTAGPKGFHDLFDSGGGLDIAGNEGFRREPIVTRGAKYLTIQFGTLTTGAVGTANPWVRGLPLVQVDDSSTVYADTGIAVVEIYALP